MGQKNRTNLLVTIMVLWQLLSGFCLTHPILCDCESQEKGLLLLCISKLALQRDNRAKVSALLRARRKVSEVANLFEVSRTTVCVTKKSIDDGKGVNRHAGSSRKAVMDRNSLRDSIRSSPRKFMRQHATRFGVGAATVQRVVTKFEAKSRVILKRPSLTPAIHAKRLESCQMLINDFKSPPARRVIIFSDEKTWTVNPVRNKRNDRYLSLGEEDQSAAFCQKRNIQHLSCRSVSLHSMAQ